MAQLDQAISDYLKAAKASTLPFRSSSISIDVDLGKLVFGAGTYFAAQKVGLNQTEAVLAGLAAALGASAKFSVGHGLKGRLPSTPFQYVSSMQERLF